MKTQKLTRAIVEAAILGFESQRERLAEQIAELRGTLDGGSAQTAVASGPKKGKRRKMSAAGRKAIAEAQRKRWAVSKGESPSASETGAAKPKRKLSAAGRRAISEATKRRWALIRAAKAGPTVAKKATAKKGAKKKAANKRATKGKSAEVTTPAS